MNLSFPVVKTKGRRSPVPRPKKDQLETTDKFEESYYESTTGTRGKSYKDVLEERRKALEERECAKNPRIPEVKPDPTPLPPKNLGGRPKGSKDTYKRNRRKKV